MCKSWASSDQKSWLDGGMADNRHLDWGTTSFLGGCHEAVRDTGCVCVCVTLCPWYHPQTMPKTTHPTQHSTGIRYGAWQKSLLSVTNVPNGNPTSRRIVNVFSTFFARNRKYVMQLRDVVFKKITIRNNSTENVHVTEIQPSRRIYSLRILDNWGFFAA